MHKIRKSLFSAGFGAVFAVTAGAAGARPAAAQVAGRIQVTDAGGRPAPDLGNAVVYIEGRGPRAAAARMDMVLDARQFRPRVIVVPAGTTVNFPNQDPFNHNVFSLAEPNAFDLGLYGRGEAHEQRFRRAGLVRVYCNIHPRMTGFIMVRDNAWYTQPGVDGRFTIADVPPGQYTLKVWHERAGESSQPITVPSGGLDNLTIALDASGFQYVQHKNKYGQDYGSGTTRERY
jgi:plastocyanin